MACEWRNASQNMPINPQKEIPKESLDTFRLTASILQRRYHLGHEVGPISVATMIPLLFLRLIADLYNVVSVQ